MDPYGLTLQTRGIRGLWAYAVRGACGLTELTFGTIEMPAAQLGPENPLAPLHAPKSVIEGLHIEDSICPADRELIGYGLDTGCLPYGSQDQYDRGLNVRSFKTAILENEVLKATFLLEFGGRLWSLYHKQRQRELLYVNPVFRLGNLAIRDAWFSGGIEWNPSIRGHSPFTCSPLFVGYLEDGNGDPVLRMYEWERIRRVPFQIDFSLPEGSSVLFVYVRLINPHTETIPMYWWSNIATPEAPSIRVIVPAHQAYTFSYREGRKSMGAIPVPVARGKDLTYPSDSPAAADYFYCIDRTRRIWIATLDEDGYGLAQTSTSMLRGRKLFVWGMGSGGRRWQEFLSASDDPYIEIQAGLAGTQMECLPMPADTEWSWLEAYGLMEADPGIAHSRKWSDACNHIESRLTELISEKALERTYNTAQCVGRRPVAEIVQRGSGWGALERRRREINGQTSMFAASMVFDDASLTDEQKPWLELLQTGGFPVGNPSQPPTAWMVQTEWRELLEQAVRENCTRNWLAWLHLGVMHYHAKEYSAAAQAWKTSASLESSAWAYRNLAVLADDEKRFDDAVDLMAAGYKLQSTVVPLAIEYCRSLVRAERYREALRVVNTLPDDIRNHARIQSVAAFAALNLDDLPAVEQFLNSGIELPTIREGEIVLTDLWFEMHAKRLAAADNVPIDDALRQRARREYQPPYAIDFRMFEET